MHSILANTAIERIPTFHADHDYPQISLGDAGIEFAEQLFVPVFEQHLVFLLVRHEVPTLPVIHPRPELGVIQIYASPKNRIPYIPSCISHKTHHLKKTWGPSTLLSFAVPFNHPPSQVPWQSSGDRHRCYPRASRTLHSMVRSLRICLVSSFNPLPFFELRRPGEFVDRRPSPPVLVPGLTLMFERRVRHVAGPLLNSHRCRPSAPPWAPIYRCPYSLATSEAFAVQTLCMGLNLVNPPLSALAALPESLLHDRP